MMGVRKSKNNQTTTQHAHRSKHTISFTQQSRALTDQSNNAAFSAIDIEYDDDPFLSLGQGPMWRPASLNGQAVPSGQMKVRSKS
jgi:hypothetical protein